MFWIALAIFCVGWWISNSIDEFSASADRLNDTIERLIWDLQDEDDD
jgi:hypothetical protein